jgi:kynurenine formamidase
VARLFPRFDELPVRPGAPPGSSWGVFDGDVGTLAFAGPDEVRAAAALVRRGVVFPLDLPLDVPGPALFHRRSPRHTVIAVDVAGDPSQDDYLDGFWLQGASQWDALRHFGDGEHGFYGGHAPETLGVERWAARGIAGRGVLLDVARRAEFDPHSPFVIGAELLDATARAQGVELRRGDVVLVRTGWLARYFELAADARAALAAVDPPPAAGLGGPDLPAFLWERGVAAIAADNPALETLPPPSGRLDLHRALIARLGMAVGELFDLERLADDCAADGVYEALFTAAPLHLRGGAGSPANALALK